MALDVRSVLDLARAAVDELVAHLSGAAVPDPARCQRGRRCEAAEHANPGDTDSPMVGAPTDRPLCLACERALPGALRQAPLLWVELRNATLLRGSTANTGTKVDRTAGSPLGLNGPPLYLAEQLHWWITAWADVVIYTAGRPAPDRAGQAEGQQIDDACALLTRYLQAWISHRPVEFQTHRSNADPDDPKAQPTGDVVVTELAGWEGCAWLLDWRRTVETALGKKPLVHHPPEPCPACNVQGGLRRRDGDDKVSCSICRKEWTLKMYETFVHAWIGTGR